MTTPFKILYICTHNRCRSILCEAISNAAGAGAIEARSAGSQPSGEVHPLSLRYLDELGIATTELRSQSWDEHRNFAPDLVITVCDSAAGEACPLWLGSAQKVHWGLADPSKLTGSDSEIAAGFHACIAEIQRRTAALLALNLGALPADERLTALRTLGAH
ncbi:arsenate reductase ArsC [Zhongshania aliphaticivorans]|jgi:arsenate reductase|uniref:Arsenate reductase n=1 Tax=Zhongshania aliphaticivorans TaxID=1470434 RepID=A0A127M632_9GAMM|nr:arsenate reductase ArsC [Zhongshania aliphaticivorans]AMO68688.1 arsenate reductase [Zhongshania aliphaticivorans]|tara:strand:- start:18850 stop:19332 length:483 start_codon:yes stop_codon:yes gene_type:complete